MEVKMKSSNKAIEKRKRNLEQKRKEIEETQLVAFRELLPNHIIDSICRGYGYSFRKRLLTPVATIFHMIGAAISRESSFQSAWHNAGHVLKSDILSKARARVPLGVWKSIANWVCTHIATEFSNDETWKGHRLIGVDVTCVSMSDTLSLVARFGRSGSKHGESRFPLSRIVFAFSLNTLTVVSYAMDKYTCGENALFAEAVKDLQEKDIIIGDRRFAGANLYVDYKRTGLEFITRAHQRLQVEKLHIVKKLGNDDYLVQLPIQRSYRNADKTLPESTCQRVVKAKVTIRGRKTFFWLVTSLHDASKYTAGEIRQLYKKRWKVETLIEEIKDWLGANVLRSKTAEGVLKEMQARIMAHNMTHWLILKASKKHKHNHERLSFSATLRLIAAYSLKMSEAPFLRLRDLYEKMLKMISQTIVIYRPDRIEPRLIKRDKKRYPALKTSRTEWRLINAMVA